MGAAALPILCDAPKMMPLAALELRSPLALMLPAVEFKKNNVEAVRLPFTLIDPAHSTVRVPTVFKMDSVMLPVLLKPID